MYRKASLKIKYIKYMKSKLTACAQALVSFKKYMPPMEEEGAYIF